jgi:hypothetical protein
VLRLLPGEETIFELRVVNHGDPANISVDTSPPLIKAMRLKRANHHVDMEEIIPVLARMPDNLDRLDGEILVTSEQGTSRIPISLISEGDGSGEDEDEGLDTENRKKSKIFESNDDEGEDNEDYDGGHYREHNGRARKSRTLQRPILMARKWRTIGLIGPLSAAWDRLAMGWLWAAGSLSILILLLVTRGQVTGMK